MWGIVGGTFNPVHMGHLILAESILNSVGADGILFIPTRSHPFKSGEIINNYDDRLAMLKLGTADNNSFQILEPPDSPYTIDLIDFIYARYPQAEFFMVIGSDILSEFSSWYRYEDIVENIKIIIAARPGYKLSAIPPILKSAERVMIPQYDISSSAIRERLVNQISIKYMVPEAVEKYIYEKRLYARS